jgi:aspartyl-tRNA synthetase
MMTMRLKRTHYCGLLTKNDLQKEITLAGWVQNKRDHGGLIFVDLRDRSGIVQLVFDYQKNATFFTAAEKLRPEYVLAVKGEVKNRSAETVNPSLATGDLEIYVQEMEILNASRTPPFYIEDGIDTDENVRLKYRYLDLRRFEMQSSLHLRHRVLMSARKFLDQQGFWEIETPLLTRSTPEGARDYLVPSRTVPGSFYALPQSPQLFKQLLMISGVDKYFQVARCFRDEDLRADRQPEFTQVDLELSFCTAAEIRSIVEGLVCQVFKETLGKELSAPFKVLSYKEAMERFGSDKPDTRFGMEIIDITAIARESGFKVFQNMIDRGGTVKGLNAKGCGRYSRREIDILTRQVQLWGTGGLAWIALTANEIKTPLGKFFTVDQLAAIQDKMGGEPGDLLLLVADQAEASLKILGQLRVYMAQRLGLIPRGLDHFLWVIDFPLLAYDAVEKRYTANHHPFTAPLADDLPLLEKDPLAVRSQAYDLVYNGTEVAGGSMRIHQKDLQKKIFHLLNLQEQEQQEKFGFFLQAFAYGVPPHGGIAFGLDRLLMLMAGKKSIRDVIPFPKTAAGACLLSGAPAPVYPEQLKELHILTIERDNKGESGS